MTSFLDSMKLTIELHNVIELKIQQIEKLIGTKTDKKTDSTQIEVYKQKMN